MALAPLAVIPEYREMHVGTNWFAAGIDALPRPMDMRLIFVLGDVLYYERFGFSSRLADPFEVKWQGQDTSWRWNSPRDALKGKIGSSWIIREPSQCCKNNPKTRMAGHYQPAIRLSAFGAY